MLPPSQHRIAVLALVVLLAGCAPPSEEAVASDLDPTVILISIDGFRWDYMDRFDTPALDRIANEGAKAGRLIPVFPTQTFPNHYSAVTGLYPDGHGIVSNTMYDPVMNARFSLSSSEAVGDGRWWGGEPIWVTAETQGRTTATFFWPGSEAPIKDVRPSFWYTFDNTVPGAERVDQVFAWLELPAEERPTFITLYFSEPDVAGHRYGPDSPEMALAVERVDGYLDRLVDGLHARGLLDHLNLIVISDHGLAARSPERVVVLDRYLDPSRARIVTYSPVLMMYPAEGTETETFDALRMDPHLDVYWKDDLPARYHLDHPRTPPLVAVAHPGWSITTRERYERNPEGFRGGTHGYDHLAPSMAGLFVARGPAFRPGARVDSVEIIQLYELMCAILGLEPAPNDGRPGALHALLIPQPSSPNVEN